MCRAIPGSSHSSKFRVRESTHQGERDTNRLDFTGGLVVLHKKQRTRIVTHCFHRMLLKSSRPHNVPCTGSTTEARPVCCVAQENIIATDGIKITAGKEALLNSISLGLALRDIL